MKQKTILRNYAKEIFDSELDIPQLILKVQVQKKHKNKVTKRSSFNKYQQKNTLQEDSK